MSSQKFFYCRRCGNMVGVINDSGIPMICCGEKLIELVPNTTEASTEKHVPVVNVSGDTVTVQIGSAPHPMEKEHHIAFIYLETESGGQRKRMSVGGEPKATFSLSGDKPIAAYAYCNLHGLWKTDI